MCLFFVSIWLFLVSSCGTSGSEEGNEFSEEEFPIEGQTTDGFEDGTYCADVTYDNPNTGTSSDYTLEVEVKGNKVTQINWGNGGWMDEDHFNAEDIDEDGNCSFTSDKGYDYTVHITGRNCGGLDSDNQYTKLNLPKYSFEEAVAITGMTQEEINDCNIYSKGDVLSENDMFILKKEIISIRAYLNSMHGYDQGYDEEIEDIKNSQKKLQEEIANGYIQNIQRSTAYGVLSQIITIKKKGVNYTLEVRGSEECTMGTAKFNENLSGWQMVYIKQYPEVDHWSGHSMRIIN
jgi:hypothetical protein